MNAFKQLLKTAGGHPPVGTWIGSASPLVAEAIGCAGFDWGVIDMAHAPLDLRDVLHLLQAVATTKMVPVVRVPCNDAVAIERVLGIGATTVLVPFVQNADDARRAVAAMRYPPAGVRSVAGNGRASKFGTLPHYAKSADQGMGVIVQLQTAQSLEQLDAIAAVEGVDALFLAPADVAASMGHLGESTHPAVTERLARAAQRCKQLNKPVGTVGDTPEVVAQYRAHGFDYVAIGSDLGLLMRAAHAAIAALRTQDAVHVHTLSAGTHTSTTY